MERKLNGGLEELKIEVKRIIKHNAYTGQSIRRDLQRTYLERERLTEDLIKRANVHRYIIEYDISLKHPVIKDLKGKVVYPLIPLHLQNRGLDVNGYGKHRFVFGKKR